MRMAYGGLIPLKALARRIYVYRESNNETIYLNSVSKPVAN